MDLKDKMVVAKFATTTCAKIAHTKNYSMLSRNRHAFIAC